MSTKNLFIPSNWSISDDKVVTCWVNSANAIKASKFKLVATGKYNLGASTGFPTNKIGYTEFTFKIDNDVEIHKERNGSTISWTFFMNGANIMLTYRNQYSNCYYYGKTRSVENIDRLLL